MAGRDERWALVEEGERTLTVVNPRQFEVGQRCVITRRHVATLLDLSDQECGAIMAAAKRVAEALCVRAAPSPGCEIPRRLFDASVDRTRGS